MRRLAASVRSTLRRLAGALAALLLILAPFALAEESAPAPRAATIYDYEIVNVFPHDETAFTQGLFIADGRLFESTGLHGQSTVREVDLETGAVKRAAPLADDYFGEGIARWKDRVIGLTWRSGKGFVYDAETLEPVRSFDYPGEGWGLTASGDALIMSDGTADLRFLDPETFEEKRRVTVMHKGKPIRRLNELEFIDGAVFANIWYSDLIVRIDPDSGLVTGVVDLRGLRAEIGDNAARSHRVLNGIAYDAESERLFVTGKNWPKLFEIRLVERAPASE